MSPAYNLFDLQGFELAIERARKALAEIEARLKGNEALERTRARVAEERGALAAVQAQQRDVDLEVRGIVDHVRDLETKLYSGGTTSTKELMGFQQDVASLQRRRAEREELLLQVMLQGDEAEETLRSSEAALADEESRWSGERERLEREREQHRLDLTQLGPQHEAAAAVLSAQETAVYRRLQSSRGTAVARVERGICGGCGISLPSGDLQRARTSNDLVRCGGCGRVLHVGV